MITVAHFYNEIINHYGISTQEKLGGSKLQPHSVANPTKAEHAHQAHTQKNGELKNNNPKPVRHKTHHANRTSDVFPF